jgi:hypothetical protein
MPHDPPVLLLRGLQGEKLPEQLFWDMTLPHSSPSRFRRLSYRDPTSRRATKEPQEQKKTPASAGGHLRKDVARISRCRSDRSPNGRHPDPWDPGSPSPYRTHSPH